MKEAATYSAECAAKVLLESIVYYDLAERRGKTIADAMIDELVTISEIRAAVMDGEI